MISRIFMVHIVSGLVNVQALFRRAQLKALVDIHSSEFQSEGLGGGYLSPEEINIIRGALDMTEKKAFVGMTPLDKVGLSVHCLYALHFHPLQIGKVCVAFQALSGSAPLVDPCSIQSAQACAVIYGLLQND